MKNIHDTLMMDNNGEKIILSVKKFKISKQDKDPCLFNLRP